MENVRLVIDYYKKKLRETPKDIGIDEYMAMAGPDGRDYLDELAVKGYEGMMHVEQCNVCCRGCQKEKLADVNKSVCGFVTAHTLFFL